MAKGLLFGACLLLALQFASGMFTGSWPTGINFDLDGLRLKLTPTSTPTSVNSAYTACITNAASSPSDFGGGWTVSSFGDDESKKISFTNSKLFKYYGANFAYVVISSNGNFQFTTTPDTAYNGTATVHFNQKRISTLFTDLSPNTGGVVRYKQLTDGFVVQFLNVTSYNSNLVNTFESRFSWNGTIDLSWFNCAPTGPTTVGLSNKGGSSELRTLVNISALAVCPGVTLAPRPGSNPSPFTCTRSLATPPVNLTKELFPEKVRGLYPTADTPAPSSGPTVKPAPGDVTKDMSTRIVGGTTVTNRTAYPFMAVILDQAGNHVCGGSLISRKYVLTAAHCASASYQVALNTLNLAPFDSTVQVRAIVNRYVHPDYDENTIDNDLAVMEIESFVSDNFIFIRTNMTRYETPGTMMRVIGWGHSAGVIGPDGSGTVEEKRLQQVDLPVISWADCTYPASCGSAACQVGYPEYWVTNETMICAGYAAGGKDPCFGDSGGPMFTATPPYVQVGIVSWGEGCALPNRFGVFTRISKYVTWLRQFIDDAVFNCNAYKPGEDGVSSPPPPSPPPPSPPPPSPPPPSPPSASDVTVLDAYTEMKALAVRDGQGGSSSFNAAERALLALYRRMQVAVDDPISAKTPSTDQLLLDLYRRMQELD